MTRPKRNPIVGRRRTSKRRHAYGGHPHIYRGAPGTPVGSKPLGPLVANPDEPGVTCGTCGLRIRLRSNGNGMRRHTGWGYQPGTSRMRVGDPACPGGEPPPIPMTDDLPDLERQEAADRRLDTMAQLARRYAITPATMRRWAQGRGFPRPVAKLYAPGGPRLYDRYLVDAWVQQHHPKAQP